MADLITLEYATTLIMLCFSQAVLGSAIVLSGLAMVLLADSIARFLEKNRVHEVLCIFLLLIAGVLLLVAAGPAAAQAIHDNGLKIMALGRDIIAMSDIAFYLCIVILVAGEIIQSGNRHKSDAGHAALLRHS